MTIDMELLQNILECIKEDEGCRLKPYYDTVGKLTIGYGRNLDDKGISRFEAELMLMSDIDEVVDDLCRIFGKEILDEKPERVVALASMRFNLGPAGFRGFKKMIEAVKGRKWEIAAKEAEDSKWSKQVPNRAKKLIAMLKS